jgi:hypothetical protein
MKNKTIAAWLSFLGGPLGLHRFYLRGMGDWLGWLLPIPTALGLYGIERARMYGLDDGWSWALIPLLGFTIAGCALMAIIYGLMTPEKWNARFNAGAPPDAAPGRTNWATIGAPLRHHGADGQHRVQLPALLRTPGRGRPEDFTVAVARPKAARLRKSAG